MLAWICYRLVVWMMVWMIVYLVVGVSVKVK